MTLVKIPVPSLVGGISHQPDSMRFASQADDSLNTLPRVSAGLTRRPPSQYIGKVLDVAPVNVFVFPVQRPEGTVFLVLDGSTAVAVDENGGTRPITFSADVSYLSASDPERDFRAVVAADYVFVVNRKVTVSKGTKTSPQPPFQALIVVKQAVFKSTYSVYIDGVQVATTTPSDNVSTNSDFIASDLESQISTSLGAGWVIQRSGHVIHVKKADGSAFSISTEDGRSGTAMVAITGEVQRFSDLPTVAPDGYTVRVRGDQSSAFNDYYVTFRADAGSGIGSGVWEEGVAPGIVVDLDPATMPHAFKFYPDGSIVFDRIPWGERTSGDEDSNPWPSFVDKTINDVFFAYDRLGFVSDINVIMSRTGRYFDFFRESVIQLVDDDPIDISASSSQTPILKAALSWNKKLLLFSDSAQFVLDDDGSGMSPRTVSLSLATQFQALADVRPVGAGSSVFFGVAGASGASLYEYYVRSDTGIEDAADITAHVPRLLPSGIRKLVAIPGSDMLVVQADDLYVYKYFWSGNEKVQSAWVRWQFPRASVVSVDTDGDRLVLFAERDGALFLEAVDVRDGVVDASGWYKTHLDRAVTPSAAEMAYTSTANETAVQLPYAVDDLYVFVTGSGDQIPGSRLFPKRIEGNVVVFEGNVSDRQIVVGLPFETVHTLSTVYVRAAGPSGRGSVPVLGHLLLRTISLSVKDSGPFDVLVIPKWNPENVAVARFTGRLVGTYTAMVNRPPVIDEWTGQFPLFVRSTDASIQISTSTPFPMQIQNAEVLAWYAARGRRI